MTLVGRLRGLFGSPDPPEGPPDPEDVAVPATLDSLLDVISVERRRWLLREIHARDDGDGVDIGDLALGRAAVEEGVDPHMVSSKARKAVYVAIYQTHLPKMADHGLVEYEQGGAAYATPATAEAVDAIGVAEAMVDESAATDGPVEPDDLLTAGGGGG